MAFVGHVIRYALLFVVLLIVIIPLLWAVAASFSPNDKVFLNVYPFSWRALLPVDFTLEAYRVLFEQRAFGQAALNTLILSTATVIAGTLISALAGFAFAKFDFKGKNLLFALVLISFMVPVEVIVIPLYILVKQFGWIDTWLGLFVPGLTSTLVVFLFRQFFADVPQELIDAARVDGASWLTILLRVVFPISTPVLVSGGIVLFLGTWNSFFWPLVVAQKPDLRVIQVAISLSVESHRTLWNELMAGSVFAALVPILLLIPFQRYYIRSISTTGLK